MVDLTLLSLSLSPSSYFSSHQTRDGGTGASGSDDDANSDSSSSLSFIR